MSPKKTNIGFFEDFLNNDEMEDFSFMENLPFGENGYIFLHGYCMLFTEVVAYYNPSYTICHLKDDENDCIHSFCMDSDYNLIDVRGKTKDSSLFWEEFEDWYTPDAPTEDTRLLKFQDLNEYLSYLESLWGKDWSEDSIQSIEARVEANDIYLNYNEYYKEEKS